MATPSIGEIRMVSFNFAPRGYALCNGQLLSISQNTALFAILGTTYGGDGITTFGLPNLQSRVPVHAGQGSGLSTYVEGQSGGVKVSLSLPRKCLSIATRRSQIQRLTIRPRLRTIFGGIRNSPIMRLPTV
jgi:microcystin-dependent protein